MKTLLIIPTTMHNFSFSAPLAWIFSRHLDKISAVYGFELTRELVQNNDTFIIELNWFIQLAEFSRLTEYIKKQQPTARICFGGLYSALKYREIFRRYPVDYFIQGDNEVPIQMFLDGENPKNIPNMIGRNFENPVTYIFKEEDYDNLEYSLDWFPSYYSYIEPGQMYQLPMLITNKGGCTAVHKECDYCMGARHETLAKIYHRPPIIMSNTTLVKQIQKLEKKFDRASLIVLCEWDYDFSNRYFDIDMNIEIDSPAPINKIGEILYAFKKCDLNLSVYEEGLCGEAVRKNLNDIIALEDDGHRVRFFAYDRDAAKLDIPADHLMPSESVLPDWTYWSFYMDFDRALVFSEVFYHQLDNSRKFSERNESTLPDIQFDLD